jgi:hypothetical protein
MALNESDLLRLLHSAEHTFVERKTIGDARDCVKTIAAFANTLPNDQEGVLFFGATDNGEIEAHSSSLDKLQTTIADKIQSIYPAVHYTTKTVHENGRECLAVIVAGSPSRPHFGGPLFIRDGPRTVVASSEKYESLLATRTATTYELQRWQGKEITVRTYAGGGGIAYTMNQTAMQATVVSANQFYVTVSFGNRNESYPLSRVQITFDDAAKRLEIEVEGLSTTF